MAGLVLTAELERQGVYRDEKTGELFLPATQRPDGSWRKPRRVKQGYIPQEEVPTYENKGVSWMKSREGYIPGLVVDEPKPSSRVEYCRPPSTSSTSKTEVSDGGMTKSAKKNAKRKEKRHQKAAEDPVTEPLRQLSLDKPDPKQTNSRPAQSSTQSDDSQVDIQKKIRNLKKKLRQVDELKKKIDSGEIANPEKTQLEKIARRDTLVEELEDLELQLED